MKEPAWVSEWQSMCQQPVGRWSSHNSPTRKVMIAKHLLSQTQLRQKSKWVRNKPWNHPEEESKQLFQPQAERKAEPGHKHVLGFKQTYCLKVLELHQSFLVHHHRSLELAVESLLYSSIGGHRLQREESRRKLAGAGLPVQSCCSPLCGLWWKHSRLLQYTTCHTDKIPKYAVVLTLILNGRL